MAHQGGFEKGHLCNPAMSSWTCGSDEGSRWSLQVGTWRCKRDLQTIFSFVSLSHEYIYIHIYIYIYIYITIHFNIYWLYIYTYTNIVLVQTYQIPPLANLSFAPASLDHGIPSGWLLCAWPLPLSPNCAGFLVAICQGRHGIGLQVGAGPMTWYHPRPSAITHSRFLFLSLD